MQEKIEQFKKDFLKELEEQNVAIFAGAGLSVASGHVDWRGLLKDFANEVGLDVTKEKDLIAVVQYYLNSTNNNRNALNQKILDEFHSGKLPNKNHQILARLPISTYWTTNYDKLIEQSLEAEAKIVDIKYTIPDLAKTIHGRSAILYKMHGDVDHPDNAILSKDQYEKYFQSHGAYLNALSGDLVSKTFLFIGFSFTDPNLDFVLSRIRVTFEDHQRNHYCFFKEEEAIEGEDSSEYEYRKIKQALIIEDLKRFKIHVLLVKEYSEIIDILKDIEDRFKRKTIYISGSASEYGRFTHESAENFISNLSKELVKNNFKIVSGFGLGVGSSVINGVLEEIYLEKKETLKDQLLLRPFPQGKEAENNREKYRQGMISYSGASIFIFGNKKDDNKTVLASGVRREFEISVEQNSLVIPVGATGFVAKELWDEVLKNYSKYFGSDEHIELFKKLGDEKLSPEKLIESVIEFLGKKVKI